ncbi:MAG: WG repeat-containing protein [Candidatus Melainabacteria bacterium]|nr:WG repeat-containing protein [Candidatus Melainabacteria bacterium]
MRKNILKSRIHLKIGIVFVSIFIQLSPLSIAASVEPTVSNELCQLNTSLRQDVGKKSGYVPLWKCGYVDKSGKTVIATIFDACKPFSEGLAPVREQEKWGFVDTTGAWKVMPKYSDAEPFSNGLAAVKLNKFWGYINPSGKCIVEHKYLDAKKFSEELGFVQGKDSQWNCINKSGKLVFRIKGDINRINPFSEGLCLLQRSNGAVYLNKKGEAVISDFYYYSHSFSEHLACVAVLNSKNGNYQNTFIDLRGNSAIRDSFFRAGSFKEGLAAVCKREKNFDHIGNPPYPFGRWGFIQKDGTFAIKPVFDDVGNFHQGRAQILMGKQKLCGFIDRTGQIIVSPIYRQSFPFYENAALVLNDEKWMYLDLNSHLLFRSDADICGNFHNDRAIACYAIHSESKKRAALLMKRNMPLHFNYDEND